MVFHKKIGIAFGAIWYTTKPGVLEIVDLAVNLQLSWSIIYDNVYKVVAEFVWYSEMQGSTYF